ncbi:uncharacterized protein BDR25DRAFT_345687 [Lindgomyces ingoldianus]|uniref:Uncharacterized protein n=1 Tax=Lindgomyces ingoldianus TaxID=673940 RepID=A0ACB6QIV3_9PLEO|nr:uncharacterized protein BDR25DRAFT_345687 [Lindgomyces ingoldianus]KAF2466071.1 hypothetical protein BDR25DRAFT_345687 [Lindgomyces ingoldianus]
MAKGFDGLIEFLLGEIALCGTQGAGSADFRRFVQKYYQENGKRPLKSSSNRNLPAHDGRLSRPYLEKLWNWLCSHQDVRIVHAGDTRNVSLFEFEALERQESSSNRAGSTERSRPTTAAKQPRSRPGCPFVSEEFSHQLAQALANDSDALTDPTTPGPYDSFKLSPLGNVRKHAHRKSTGNRTSSGHRPEIAEHHGERPHVPPPDSGTSPILSQQVDQDEDDIVMDSNDNGYAETPLLAKPKRGPRRMPKGIFMNTPVFDEPAISTSAPRIYASQDRTWRAIAGHSVDLQKLPWMEFALLSIIASHGADGILQPELVHISGQDKRSVPHRTDMLAKKGYIEKKPVHAVKMRTSICVHKKFVQKGHFLKAGDSVEDVFVNGNIVLSNFVGLLYKLLQNFGVVAVRDLQKKMVSFPSTAATQVNNTQQGIPMKLWNQRAIRNAVIRLAESGFLRRVRARRRGSRDTWLVCLSALREPNEDDIKNLHFKRRNESTRSMNNILEEDEDSDDIMRDLELEVDFDDNDAVGDDDEEQDGLVDKSRIPPQWDPDQTVANLIFDTLNLAGIQGCSSAFLRERTVGKFWKRPVEALMSRITDNWEESQPPHLRHLAVIRDTAVTQEKKYVHYVYRTHGHFQKAVDAREASWEAVRREAQKSYSNMPKGRSRKTAQESIRLDSWGFRQLNLNDFYGRHGASSLAVCLKAIKRGPRGTQSWDNAIYREMGDDKPGRSQRLPALSRTQLVTREELKAATELKRIREYAIEKAMREAGQAPAGSRTPTKDSGTGLTFFNKPRGGKGAPTPLLTAEQRVALGLPARGRLKQSIEDQIREHRRKTKNPFALPDFIVQDDEGSPKPKPKPKPKPGNHPSSSTQPLLTKEQRIARGLAPMGRLSKAVLEELRRERGIVGAPATPDTTMNLEASQNVDDTAFTISGDKETPQSQPRTPRTMDQLQSLAGMNDQNEPIDATTTPQATPSTATKRKAGEFENHPIKRMRKPRKTSAVDTPGSEHRTIPKSAVASPFQTDALAVASSGLGRDGPQKEADSWNHAGSSTTPYPPATSVQEISAVISRRVEEIVNKFTQRSEPGIYVNPFMTRPIARGRPRKALFAIFKSSRLKEFEWFRPDPTVVRRNYELSIPGQKKRKRARPSLAASKELTPGNDIVAPSAEQEEGHPSTERARVDQTEDAEAQVAPAEPEQPEAIQAADDVPLMIETQASVASTNVGPPNPPISQPEQLIFQSSHPTWTPINFPAAHTPTYVSPYVNTSVPPIQSATPPTTEKEGGDRKTSNPAQTTDNDEYAVVDLSEGNSTDAATIYELSTRAYTRKPRYLAFPSGVRLGQGSVHHLRRQIFLELLARCGGVFPGNGEIANPFYTLWDKRAAPGWNKPDRSTLNNTVKFLTQSSKLKRFQFQMTNFYGEKEIDKTILALPHLTPSSPEVKELQRNMISVYPKRFIPKAVHDLLGGQDANSRVVPLADIDATIEIPDSFAEEKLEQRITASARARRSKAESRRRKDLEERKRMNEEIERYLLGSRGCRHDRVARMRLETLNAGPLTKSGRSNNGQSYLHMVRQFNIDDSNESDGGRALSPTPSASSEDSLSAPHASSHFEFVENTLEDGPRDTESTSSDFEYVGPRPRYEALKSDLKPVSGRRTTSTKADQPRDDDGFVNIDASAFDPQYEMQTVTTLLDPNIRFHSTTGTFSTEFAVQRNARIHLWVDPSNNPVKNPLKSLSEIRTQGLGKSADEVAVWPQEKAMLEDAIHRKFYQDVGNIIAWEEQYRDFLLRAGLPEREDAPDSFINLEFPGRHETAKMESLQRSLRPGVSYRSRSRKRIRIFENDNSDLVDDEGPQKKNPHSQKLLPKVHGVLTSQADDDEGSDPALRYQQKHTLNDEPTVVQRLVGLTGNPEEPTPAPRPRPRGYRLRNPNRDHITRAVFVEPDITDKFKKLFLTLVIASSMSGEDGGMDWSIVEKVYSSDSSFNQQKLRKIWNWMQRNMASQVNALNATFQSSFLNAYENGILDSIEDFKSYDWGSLVQWAMRNCKYPSALLPKDHRVLRDYFVDESNYEPFNRRDWYKKDFPLVHRERRTLDLNYYVPMHPKTPSTSCHEHALLRARSWIRSNIATPQSIYDSRFAHDKLYPLGAPVIKEAVKELVDSKAIKQRKSKRLMPGRNFNFTATLAIQYKRTLELVHFMEAVEHKKKLDAAFSNIDIEKRVVEVSRSADEGFAIMLYSLLNEGRVRMVPRLPPINNDIDGPSPRISKWGFVTAEYNSRGFDRWQLFWDIDVVPTSIYQYGSPLLPLKNPLPSSTGSWAQIERPPLSDPNDPNALLPIWSSIDGRTVIWPWWNRVLNLILHALVFLPGSSAKTIHRQCSKGAELFEVEMVLSWLVSVNAASKHGAKKGGVDMATYRANPGFWAAFGDQLIGEKDDWFGEHIKKKKSEGELQWRSKYNTRFSQMVNSENGMAVAAINAVGNGEEEASEGEGGDGGGYGGFSDAVLWNSRSQYRYIKGLNQGAELSPQVRGLRPTRAPTTTPGAGPLLYTIADGDSDAATMDWEPTPRRRGRHRVSFAPLPRPQDISVQEEVVENEDVDIDAEGEPEDIDAEGEPDDEMI